MGKYDSDLVDVEVHVHHETPKAWRVSDTGDDEDGVWVPKSQCELKMKDAIKGTITLPEWLAKEKGFI